MVTDILTTTAWMEEAACKGMNVNLFFPRDDGAVAYSAVKVVCDSCPVAQECLDWALTTDSRDGMFGGYTPLRRKQHQNAASNRQQLERELTALHGTARGYYIERALELPICRTCRVAETLRAAERSRKRAAAIRQARMTSE